jgi:trimeric autotransporter adhesin
MPRHKRTRQSRRQLPRYARRLALCEPLEQRQLLSATILGQFWAEAVSAGSRDAEGGATPPDVLRDLTEAEGEGGGELADVPQAEGESLPTSWTNPQQPLDVNNDSFVTAIDALLIINVLNTTGARPLNTPTEEDAPPPYFDCSGDWYVSALDALRVINYLNRSDDDPVDPGTTFIELKGDSVAIDGSGATAEGSIVTITSAGEYHISGTLDDGQVIVDTSDQGTVTLILKGANITCSDNASIYVANAEETVITLATGTQNYISDGESYDNEGADEPDAAIFSKYDLTIDGDGSLTVNANFHDGIASKDDLNITGGNITVNAVNHGIQGRGSVVIDGGSITIDASGDGIQASNGYIAINGGTIIITALDDGIQAETALTVSGGSITATATGKALTAGGDIAISAGTIGVTNSGAAGRGIDADGNVTFTGGTTKVSLSGATVLTASGGGFDPSYPTGVKANGRISVSETASVSVSGTSAATGARGLAADSGIAIRGGSVTTNLAGGGAAYVNASGVEDAYRAAGISSHTTIDVTGGTINLTASGAAGCGFNAAGTIIFAGGTTTVSLSNATLLTASGRGFNPSYPTGVNSDTTITVSAGSLTVTGTSAATGARGLSADGAINVTGGTINVTLAGNGATYTNSLAATDSYSAAAFSADSAISITGGTVTTISSGTGGKGLKSQGTITLGSATSSPTLNITTTGARFLQSGSDYNHPKTIVAAGAINVASGTITLNSTDDGIHSDTSITISGGTNIINAVSTTQGVGEGVEAPIINFTGGVTSIAASNDGINATYGTVNGGTESNDGSQLNISGGIIIVAGADAIDANGSITITGGTTIVDGPATGVEEGIDFNGTFLINGGTLISGGCNSPMTRAASTGSTQVNFLLKSSTALASTSLLHIVDSSGNEVLTYKPKYNASYFHVSTSALAKNTSYSVYFGGYYTGGSYVGGLTSWGLLTGGMWSSTGSTLKRTFTTSASSTVNTVTV